MNKYIFTLIFLSTILQFSCSRKLLEIPASRTSCMPSKSVAKYDSLVTDKLFQNQYDSTTCLELKTVFSNRSLAVAKDIGVSKLLCDLVNLKQQSNQADLFLKTRLDLNDRITLAQLDITSTISVLECEVDRINEVKSHLQTVIDKRSNRLTVWGIIAGALAGFGTSALTLGGSGDPVIEGVATAGGVAAVGLGVAVLFSRHEIQFYHPENVVNDIVEKPNISVIFPRSVWNFMTKPFNKDGQVVTGLELMKKHWEEQDFWDPENADFITLMKGEGGKYKIDDLDARSGLIHIIEAEVNYMNYDIKRLQQEILLFVSK